MNETPSSRPDLKRVKEIFHEVVEAAAVERERILQELCGVDDGLRAEVESLLEAEDGGSAFLDAQPIDRVGAAARAAAEGARSDPAEAPGRRIGPYKLLQRIGEGGFGVVYMAEQEEPIRRRVALKVIKPGMDTKQVIARFEAERQALAMLDHPNIAKVHDAGATPLGRPYFVMELVKGIPITEYCDEQRLGARERLELFGQVCGAVHHAHENGIIHRDLKPSNILVTLHDGTPVPKVIDFGVAKAIRQKLTESTLFTEYNQLIGTPEYMAPEQAAYAGLDVDRRSDVYSLGALLYELLTGTTPFEARKLRRAAQLEVLRILKEEEPPKPSTRIHTLGKSSEPLARDRRTDPSGLTRLLRGDLDWIVMKALEKDRARRYESASELAADIGRYFDQRPIVARPPSFGYRARKLLRRRRGPVAAAAVVVLALVADVAYMGWERGRMAAAGPAVAALPAPGIELLVSSEDTGSCFFEGQPSPDGSRMLHTNWCTGSLYVRDLESGSMELVTEYDFDVAAWLPDGDRISVGPTGPFDSPTIIDLETRDQLVHASLAGLTLFPRDWSPDGDHLLGVFHDEDGDRATVLMSLSSGERTVVTNGAGGARFSPDGRHVLFADGSEGDDDLLVLEVESGERWPLVEGPEDEGDALWSPEGTTVVYQTGDELWALPVRDGRATGRPRLVLRDAVHPQGWNEHGFYYGVYNAVNKVHRVGIDPVSGEATGSREPIPLPDATSDPVKFRWSPDMRRMAVASRYEGALHVMDGQATTSFPIPGHQPDRLWWSADGREVLFANLSWGDGPAGTVFAVDVESGSVRELFPEVEGLTRIHVSPGGRRMVGARAAPDVAGYPFWDLVLSDLGEERAEALARPNEYGPLSGRASQPFFSPDGSWILFVRNTLPGTAAGPYSFSLWVVRADGSGERMLAEAPFLLAAEWDPTSRRIAYQAVDEAGDPYLRVVSVDDGTSTRIEGLDDLEEWRLLDWSPDGAWLAIGESLGRWEFWVNRDLLGGDRESR